MNGMIDNVSPALSQPAAAPTSGPLADYLSRVERGALKADDAQRTVAEQLQALHEALSKQRKKSLLPIRKSQKSPRGIYLWGNVGRGKSMLMDVFFTHAPVVKKRRVHFHRFMQETHARIHALRQITGARGGSGDPVALYIDELKQSLTLLCFDELQATDVADATLIFRLFEGLFEAGVVIVSTSNHPPENLYTGGVQRERFDACTALLKEKMDVVALSSGADYRRVQLQSLTQSYCWPLGREAQAFAAHIIHTLAPGSMPEKTALEVHGRTLRFTMYAGNLMVASFQELCEAALGPADYLAIADGVEALLLTGVPTLTPEKRNEAKRFVTLIDALYEQKTKLFITAAAAPEQLYPSGDGSFEFQRTVSRLMEMQSANYLSTLRNG